MAQFDLRTYARRGAELRAQELLAELANIYKAFPDLRKRSATAPRRGSELGGRRAESGGVGVGNGRKPMSAAARKAVSIRMKKYWAARRKSAS